MRARHRWIVSGIVLLLAATGALNALETRTKGNSAKTPYIRLARILSDGIVLQRGVEIPVWGWANPGSRVTVSFGGATKSTVAQADSSFRVVFASRPAGNALTIEAKSEGAVQTVRNVLMGDVWIASGQSNMEWSVSLAKNGAAEAQAANDSLIREFKVPNSWSWNEEKELAGGQWYSATPSRAGAMSAVAYFFARDLRKAVNVPIGIVNTAWGGAAIAPYTSKSALGLTESAWNDIRNTELQYKQRIRDSLEKRLGALPTSDAGMSATAPWSARELDESTWRTIRVPGAWERNGYAGLDGVVWLRRTFNLTSTDVRDGKLALGTIDDDDITWINGIEIGRTNGYAVQRNYTVPATALREGSNVLTIRVSDGAGDGGVIADSAQVALATGMTRHPLAGEWKFRVGMASFADDGQHINKIPAILYNRMMHPLAGLPFKGVIWYQGESNSNNDEQAKAYRADFSRLITSWRRELNGGRSAFPFLWVQLPNYGRVDAMPPASGGWAHVRESQNAALSLPNTGQVVAIDIGEATNLHPVNKQDVGSRLALVARAIAYKQSVLHTGPTFKSMRVNGDRATLTFANAAGLSTRAAGDSIEGFAVAGADKQWKWARARITGESVEVWSDEVKTPLAVRYAWGNSPRNPNLYNGAKLPMAPFRTDNWN